MSHCPHCLRAPRALGRAPQHPEIRPSPALLLQPQGGMASSHGRVLLFPKYVCCINTIVKWKPSVGDGGVGAREGRGSVPGGGPPSPAPPPPTPPRAVGVEEERSCIPSRCQAAQTPLSSNSTWPEQFREGQGRRRQLGGGGGGGGSRGVMLNCSQAPRPCWTQKNQCFHRLVI